MIARAVRFSILCLLVVASPLQAAKTKPETTLDKNTVVGVFKVYQMGQTVGAEKFSIRFRPDGNYKAEGSLSTQVDKTTREATTVLETSGPRREVSVYQREVKINQVPTRVVMKRESAGLKIGIASGVQKSEKTMKIAPGSVLVEPGVVHHLIPLLRRYNFTAGGAQSTPVFLGSELRATTAVLAYTDDQPAALQYGTYQARRMFLNLGDVGLLLWVAPSGTLLKVENPMQGFLMEAAGYDGPKAEAPQVDLPRRKDLSYAEVTFPSGTVVLAGLLTRPAGATGRLPGLVFVSDDGPQDRDGTVPFTNVNVGTAEMMDALSAAGFVVLRADDRGVAQSKGSFPTTTLAESRADAAAALDFLRTRPEVDPARIALVGHGVGGNLAFQVAAAHAGVRAVVALAPSSVALDQLALEQTRRRFEDQGVRDAGALRGAPISYVLQQASKTNDKWLVLGEKGIFLDVFRQYAALRPLDDLGKVHQPLLLVQGGQDLQVFPHHGDALAAACQSKGMKNCTAKTFPNLDHFLKPSRGNVGEYTDPSRHIDVGFLQFVANWLKANL